MTWRATILMSHRSERPTVTSRSPVKVCMAVPSHTVSGAAEDGVIVADPRWEGSSGSTCGPASSFLVVDLVGHGVGEPDRGETRDVFPTGEQVDHHVVAGSQGALAGPAAAALLNLGEGQHPVGLG